LITGILATPAAIDHVPPGAGAAEPQRPGNRGGEQVAGATPIPKKTGLVGRIVKANDQQKAGS
jgi:hypothetical protein